MDQISVLKSVVQELDDLKLSYFLIGSFAVSYYGRPRATHDIDIKISSPQITIKTLVDRFSKQFYISEEGIREALKHRTMFNLIHYETNTKVDFWILNEDPFDQERFKRKKMVNLLGVPTAITTAEDLIIIKLKWYQESESDKHLNDVKGILEIQENKLDKKYIEKWIDQFHLQKEWKECLSFTKASTA